MLRYKTEIA